MVQPLSSVTTAPICLMVFATSLVVTSPAGAAPPAPPLFWPSALPFWAFAFGSVALPFCCWPFSAPVGAFGACEAGVDNGTAVLLAVLLCGVPAARTPHPASASAVSTPQTRYAARLARITSPPWYSHRCQVSGG